MVLDLTWGEDRSTRRTGQDPANISTEGRFVTSWEIRQTNDAADDPTAAPARASSHIADICRGPSATPLRP